MIFPAEEDLASVNDRMIIGKCIYMTVQDDPFPDKLGILKVFPTLYIISNIVADDYLL